MMATTVAPFAMALSQCNTLAAVSLQGVHLFVSLLPCPLRYLCSSLSVCRDGGVRAREPLLPLILFAVFAVAIILPAPVRCDDFTDQVFEKTGLGQNQDRRLVAFGDFNADKLTDVFVVEDDLKSVRILLAHDKPPFLRDATLKCFFDEHKIAAAIPGDFDGDGAMDILILTDLKPSASTYQAFFAWGSLQRLACPTSSDGPLLQTKGHPVVLDHNGDMIADLFGVDLEGNRQFWIFGTNRTIVKVVTQEAKANLRIPHSHAFVDADGDMTTDLVLSAEDLSYEIWRYDSSGAGFIFNSSIPAPVKNAYYTGQSVFADINSDGAVDHLVTVCMDKSCSNSSIYVHSGDHWCMMPLRLLDPHGQQWTFVPPESGHFYLQAITGRAGDYNLDGYPDLLITLRDPSVSYFSYPKIRSVLLENSPCELSDGFCPLGRKWQVKWDALGAAPDGVQTLAGAFYDTQESGVLDVLLVNKDPKQSVHYLTAQRNSLDYDANFIKVLVLTGRCYGNCTHGQVIPYGSNLAGPSVRYRTTRPNGDAQVAFSGQLSQSAYHALQLPYSLFGLGHTPNFLEGLQVAIPCMSAGTPANPGSRTWTQIIPNSQMVIIPRLDGDPGRWLNKLFVTPSRAIVLSAGALAAFGFFLASIVGVLHCRERKADQEEKLSQTNRFHFDAM